MPEMRHTTSARASAVTVSDRCDDVDDVEDVDVSVDVDEDEDDDVVRCGRQTRREMDGE